MKKLILLSILQLGFLTMHAQDSIKVIIEKKVANFGVYIKTTITNNNKGSIVLINNGYLTNFGQIIQMSSCYSMFKAFSSLSDTIGVSSDRVLFIDKSSFPRTKSPIKLNKGDSYSFQNLLYDGKYAKGIFPSSFQGKINEIQARVKLYYIYLPIRFSSYEKEFITNRLIL